MEFIIPSDTTYLDGIRNFVISIAQKFHFKQSDIDDIEFAVDEACANIMEHAYGGQKGKISINVNCNDDEFSIVIKDKGNEFDPTKADMPDIDEYHKEKKSDGLGIFIMRKLMDIVRHEFSEDEGNTLIMKKFKKIS